MELTGKMEEFMNDLIGERMEQVYQEKDGQQYDPFNEKLETKLQKIFQKLSDKQRTILFDYMTETSNKCSDLNEFYYRMGLRDGLMLKEALQVKTLFVDANNLEPDIIFDIRRCKAYDRLSEYYQRLIGK